MRIVAGSLRGCRIEAPSGNATRPTTDRVREALFSSLYSMRGSFEGATVLDAFAGSGALGIEALSRGAIWCHFYEKDHAAAAVLKQNIQACKLAPQQVHVYRSDVCASFGVGDSIQTAASKSKQDDLRFDIVFLDPPYKTDPRQVCALITCLCRSERLADGAIIVYEHAKQDATRVQEVLSSLGNSVLDSRTYGKTEVTFLQFCKEEYA